jgi:hypothetical protein
VRAGLEEVLTALVGAEAGPACEIDAAGAGGGGSGWGVGGLVWMRLFPS